jgi:hypothetical protein
MRTLPPIGGAPYNQLVKISGLAMVGTGCMVMLAVSGAALGGDGKPAKVKGHAPSTLTCDDLVIKMSAKASGMPSLDFVYPVKVTTFSFRDGNLLLIAHDERDPVRLRVVLSAQRDSKDGKYYGQFVRDSGGNEVQLDNGALECKTH